MKHRRKRLSVFILTLYFIALATSWVSALGEDDVQLSLSSNKDIDIALAVGETDVDASNFEADIKQSLSNKGVNVNRVNVNALKTSSLTSDDIDADTVFNTWDKFPSNANWFYDEENQWIHSTDNPPFETGFMTSINQDYDKFTLRSSVYSTQPSQPIGLMFNVRPTESDDTRYNMYYWWASGTHAVLFKVENIKIDNPRTMWGGTYSGTPLLSYSSNGKCSTGYCLGWTAHAPHDYGGFPHNTPLRVGEVAYNLADPVVKTTILNYVRVNHTVGWHDMGVKMSNGEIITWFDDEKIETKESSLGTGKVGFFQYSHVRPRFKDFLIETSKTINFTEIIREPVWRDDSARFLVNMEDVTNPAFDNASDLGEILPRLINEEIHYIGAGTNTNKNQTLSLIEKNNNNGIFVDNNNYNQAIDKIATYIKEHVTDVNTGSQYVLVGEPINVDVNPSSLKNDTTTSAYPQGRWRIDHDFNYYDNHLGQASWANQWQEDLLMVFDKPGRYDVSFGGQHPNPRYIYAHRRPVASFSSIVQDRGSYFDVTIRDYSYDLDLETRSDKGISEHEWRWKRTTANTWNTGMIPSRLSVGDDYIVQLRVKDYQGAWSVPESRYITTADIVAQPVANFNIPQSLSEYETLTIDDTSYDPAGRNITAREWVIQKNGQIIYTGPNPITTFNSHGTGTYRYQLKVKNSAGLWSEAFNRTVQITKDTNEPEAIVTPTSRSWSTQNAQVNVSYSDEGGSGLKYQRYAVTQSQTPPTSGWSSFSSSMLRSITVSKEGRNYVHLEAYDNAGNKLTRTVGEYQIDRSAPNLPSMKHYQGWQNPNALTVAIVHGHDELSGASYSEYRLEGATTKGWTRYHSGITITNEGVTQIEIRTIDALGHASGTRMYPVRIDRTKPTNTGITIHLKD